jgi:DNA-binding MurR/RpiR family transcriptional regulator
MIIKNRWVWVVGLRGSYAVAHDFNYKLKQIFRKSTLIEMGAGDYFETLEMIQPENLVIGFSFSRFTKTTVDIIKEGKKRGGQNAYLNGSQDLAADTPY